MLRNGAGKTHRMVSSMMEQLSMFDYKETMSPLASRLRPESLETFVGQKHLLGEGKLLRQLIDQDQIPSMIFWGPPGVGKTTLARTLAGLLPLEGDGAVEFQGEAADFAALHRRLGGQRRPGAIGRSNQRDRHRGGRNGGQALDPSGVLRAARRRGPIGPRTRSPGRGRLPLRRRRCGRAAGIA